jgi:hypothetical protein
MPATADRVGHRGLQSGQPVHDLVVRQLGMADQPLAVSQPFLTAGVPQLLGEPDQSEFVPHVVRDAGLHALAHEGQVQQAPDVVSGIDSGLGHRGQKAQLVGFVGREVALHPEVGEQLHDPVGREL